MARKDSSDLPHSEIFKLDSLIVVEESFVCGFYPTVLAISRIAYIDESTVDAMQKSLFDLSGVRLIHEVKRMEEVGELKTDILQKKDELQREVKSFYDK